MIEVEVFGAGIPVGGSAQAHRSGVADVPPFEEVRRLCVLAAASAGVRDGHVAIEFVDAQRIAHLNREYRQQPTPTDVLSFPIDGGAPIGGSASAQAIEPSTAGQSPPLPTVVAGRAESTRELGDVVICPEHTTDVREAIVHGVLHLVGMDHETDNGEMLALQRELLARERR
jgi:probable rRNA maturation factor